MSPSPTPGRMARVSAEGAVDEELRQLERAAAGGGPDEVLRRAAALEREGDRDGAWLALLPLPGRSCPGVLTRLRASPDPCMVDSVRRVGRFELVGELGRGGMGVVHRARDPQTGHEVALKLLQALDPAELARFQVEAEALGLGAERRREGDALEAVLGAENLGDGRLADAGASGECDNHDTAS